MVGVPPKHARVLSRLVRIQLASLQSARALPVRQSRSVTSSELASRAGITRAEFDASIAAITREAQECAYGVFALLATNAAFSEAAYRRIQQLASTEPGAPALRVRGTGQRLYGLSAIGNDMAVPVSLVPYGLFSELSLLPKLKQQPAYIIQSADATQGSLYRGLVLQLVLHAYHAGDYTDVGDAPLSALLGRDLHFAGHADTPRSLGVRLNRQSDPRLDIPGLHVSDGWSAMLLDDTIRVGASLRHASSLSPGSASEQQRAGVADARLKASASVPALMGALSMIANVAVIAADRRERYVVAGRGSQSPRRQQRSITQHPREQESLRRRHKRAYVSYSDLDRAPATQLDRALKDRGFSVRSSPSRVDSDRERASRIREKLRAADVVVLIIGRMPSSWTRYEWSCAIEASWDRERRVPVAAVVVEGGAAPRVLRDRVLSGPAGVPLDWNDIAQRLALAEPLTRRPRDTQRLLLNERLAQIRETAAALASDPSRLR